MNCPKVWTIFYTEKLLNLTKYGLGYIFTLKKTSGHLAFRPIGKNSPNLVCDVIFSKFKAFLGFAKPQQNDLHIFVLSLLFSFQACAEPSSRAAKTFQIHS
jgi:hypothetical protein